MIPPEIGEWHGVLFNGLFLIFVFIYFHQLTDELDDHNEKKYSDKVNYNLKMILQTKLSYILLTIVLKNYRKKSELVDDNTISQQARSTALIA